MDPGYGENQRTDSKLMPIPKTHLRSQMIETFALESVSNPRIQAVAVSKRIALPIICIATIIFQSVQSAEAQNPIKKSHPASCKPMCQTNCGNAYRPCGPESLPPALKRLVPQGSAGADFRFACQNHDACYGTPGSCKASCDQKFLQQMNCACIGAHHPRRCRRMARLMHHAVMRHGDKAFESAQRDSRQWSQSRQGSRHQNSSNVFLR